MKSTDCKLPRVFLDTNILLDHLLDRGADGINADNIFDASAEGRINLMTAAHSITNLSYITRKVFSTGQIKQAIKNYCGLCEIVEINSGNIERAIDANYDPNLEDSLQIQYAIDANADYIVTRDKKGFKNSPVRVVHPSELLEEITN